MLATTFLHKALQKSLSAMHKKRFNTLSEVVTALLGGAKLTLTNIGRHIKGDAKVKNKIKKVDRLLKNKNLQEERSYIYQQLSHLLLKSANKVVIAVDWSGCCSNERFIIQASILVAQGRSIPLYKEIHCIDKYTRSAVEFKFLDNLKSILPKGVHVIVVTDSGFKTPWFNKIIVLGWDFVGRVRGQLFYKEKGKKRWLSIKSLHSKATNKARYVGKVEIGRTIRNGRVTCHMVHYKSPKKYRSTIRTTYNARVEKHSAANREPWVLITSMAAENKNVLASRTKNIYKKRMEIEQNFRDYKSERFGFSLRYSGTKDVKRLEILLLIAEIATIMLWLIGFSGELIHLQKSFQANTSKSRVLSLLTLGKQIILHCLNKIKNSDIIETLKILSIDCYALALGK